jgi:hypothetical protein
MNTLSTDMIITLEQPALKKRRVDSRTGSSNDEHPSSRPAQTAESRNAQELRK